MPPKPIQITVNASTVEVLDLMRQLREQPDARAMVDGGRGLSLLELACELRQKFLADAESGKWRGWWGKVGNAT